VFAGCNAVFLQGHLQNFRIMRKVAAPNHEQSGALKGLNRVPLSNRAESFVPATYA
jgi:hypothetical protein